MRGTENRMAENEPARTMPDEKRAADNGVAGMAAAGESTADAAVVRKIETAGDWAEDSHRYDDIINLPRHVSVKHRHMPVSDRAAQFMPFAALTGFGDSIRETGRLTDERMELEEDVMNSLDGKLQYLSERLGGCPEISATFFQPDLKKAGGAYVTVTGRIKKIDLYDRILLMEDGTGIPMKDVVELEGEIFSDLDR